jgi:hypothetical protein
METAYILTVKPTDPKGADFRQKWLPPGIFAWARVRPIRFDPKRPPHRLRDCRKGPRPVSRTTKPGANDRTKSGWAGSIKTSAQTQANERKKESDKDSIGQSVAYNGGIRETGLKDNVSVGLREVC